MQEKSNPKKAIGTDAAAFAVRKAVHSQGFSDTKLLLGGFIAGGLLLIVLTHLPWPSPAPPPSPVKPAQPVVPSMAQRYGRPDYNQDPASGVRYLDTLARRSKGDFSRLNESERQFVDRMSSGHGKAAIRQSFHRLSVTSKAPKTGIARPQ